MFAGGSGDADIGEADACGEGVVGTDDDDGVGSVRENGVRESNEFQYEFDVAPDPFSPD